MPPADLVQGFLGIILGQIADPLDAVLFGLEVDRITVIAVAGAAVSRVERRPFFGASYAGPLVIDGAVDVDLPLVDELNQRFDLLFGEVGGEIVQGAEGGDGRLDLFSRLGPGVEDTGDAGEMPAMRR